jgi:hypothetical protein
MALPTTLQGGTTSAPNRAPAAKVIAGALANNRVAQALIAALGTYSVASAVVSTSVSPTNAQFANLAVGDYFIHIPASPGNVQATVVTTVGTAPITPVIGDLYVDLTLVNLDANNPLVPPPPAQLTGRTTGNGGTEF